MNDMRTQRLMRLLERNNLYHLVEMINNGTDVKKIAEAYEVYDEKAASRRKNRNRDARNRYSRNSDFKKIEFYLRLLGRKSDCGC
ncbi:hypothetical protein AB685_16815 [Bacillus sp. LL01]|uniref:hypothetical protein n=1 Tax=Bacillus sp. LL01 TaxID=1665556 RepID=UPI00064D5087|nr:hypothetical protein [Bacillus sp. LL01]KMJ57652.1 hypothetical protein AB685_16815 [Bacillus sp. LL01]